MLHFHSVKPAGGWVSQGVSSQMTSSTHSHIKKPHRIKLQNNSQVPCLFQGSVLGCYTPTQITRIKLEQIKISKLAISLVQVCGLCSAESRGRHLIASLGCKHTFSGKWSLICTFSHVTLFCYKNFPLHPPESSSPRFATNQCFFPALTETDRISVIIPHISTRSW